MHMLKKYLVIFKGFTIFKITFFWFFLNLQFSIKFGFDHFILSCIIFRISCVERDQTAPEL